MTATLYGIADLPARLVGRWDELLAQSSARSAFLSHAFCAAVETVRGGVFVLHVREGDGAEGFMPFQIRKGRALLGHAEKVGGSMSDYFGIVGNLRGPLDTGELLGAARLSSLRFNHAIPELCPFPFEDRENARGVRLHVSTFTTFTETLAKQNKTFLSSVRRNLRQIQSAMGAAQFTWHSAEIADLDRLIASKRQQYCRTGIGDGLASESAQGLLSYFFREVRSPFCKPVLSTLHCGGSWIASHFGLLCNGRLHIWFPVYDPQLRRYSPGHLLFFNVIESGCGRGITTFDFGEGESHYKSEYRGETYNLQKGRIYKDSVFGKAEHLLQTAQWRLSALRQRWASSLWLSPQVHRLSSKRGDKRCP